MDKYIVMQGFNGDDHWYVVKTFANGSKPIFFCDCGNQVNSTTYVQGIASALNATLPVS